MGGHVGWVGKGKAWRGGCVLPALPSPCTRARVLLPAPTHTPPPAQVTRMKPGDRVVPIDHSQGTWRSHGVFEVSPASLPRLPCPPACLPARSSLLAPPARSSLPARTPTPTHRRTPPPAGALLVQGAQRPAHRHGSHHGDQVREEGGGGGWRAGGRGGRAAGPHRRHARLPTRPSRPPTHLPAPCRVTQPPNRAEAAGGVCASSGGRHNRAGELLPARGGASGGAGERGAGGAWAAPGMRSRAPRLAFLPSPTTPRTPRTAPPARWARW